MKLGIVGVGLIGGSFALGVKEKKEVSILGWDNNPDNLQEAKKLGIIDGVAESLHDLLHRVEVVFLSIPVGAIAQILPEILDHVQQQQIVVDFGSTKEKIHESVRNHPNRSRYIGAHPIAGTEYSGPGAAFRELLFEKVMIICDREHSSKDAVATFEGFCDTLKMKRMYLTSADHDLHLAYVSHLSHITSFSLSNSVLHKEKSEKDILDLAGSGFDSTVRLAKSDPEMWASIFMANRENILQSIDDYERHISDLKNAIASKDKELIKKLLDEGRKIRRILK